MCKLAVTANFQRDTLTESEDLSLVDKNQKLFHLRLVHLSIAILISHWEEELGADFDTGREENGQTLICNLETAQMYSKHV